MKILIVEDEIKTSSFLKKGLEENGFEIDVEANGMNGLQRATSVDYDLIILDVMLPRMDGWSFISKLRAEKKSTPTLFLTARDGLNDRIKGLDLGADGYLVKPFAFSELLANIRMILRRSPERIANKFVIEDLELDLDTHIAKRGGKRLELTPKEFLLLLLLMRRKNEILSRSIISDQVWNIHFDTGTNMVDVHIRRLRTKVDDPFPKKLIKTVRGMGYTIESQAS